MNFIPLDPLLIYRGSTEQVILVFLGPDKVTPLDLAGSQFEMSITEADTDDAALILRKKTVDANGLGIGTVQDIVDGVPVNWPALIWSPTPAESRLIPRNGIAYAEFERRIESQPGVWKQEIWLRYEMKGLGGSNRDE
jgi:hypothetical protein